VRFGGRRHHEPGEHHEQKHSFTEHAHSNLWSSELAAFALKESLTSIRELGNLKSLIPKYGAETPPKPNAEKAVEGVITSACPSE